MKTKTNRQAISTPNLLVPSVWRDVDSVVISCFLCAGIAFIFILTSAEQFLHWFIVPVILCGSIIGTDAIDWLRGRMDLMDPVGWLGLFGLHFFFLSPLLIVFWDYQMPFLPPVSDWRPWLGGMGILNIAGLVIYRVSRRWIKLRPPNPYLKIRVIDSKLLVVILYFALAVTLGLQIMVYVQSGGIAGYIQRYEEQDFAGSGSLFAISESFPFLFMIALVTYARSHGNRQSWLFILLILALFFILRIFFGGLRGSRSNTIYAMIWAMGVIHVWLRPVPRRFLALGAIFGVLFLYLMGFYKSLGSDVGRVLSDPTQLSLIERETNRTFQLALISDLSRADVQAYMLRNLRRWENFPYGWGRTYPAGYMIVIPRATWPTKPHGKIVEGTQALHGPGTFRPGILVSSRVYGLMGEAMLNFGVFAAPLMFITLGILVGYTRRWYYNLHPFSASRLWIPFLILFCLTYVVSDSDNNASFFAFRMAIPGIILWMGTRLVIPESIK